MRNQILLRFLENGLINVGGDDAKLEKLQKTAIVLSKVLQKNPAKTTAFALTAFDPDIRADQPVMKEVKAALSEQWQTYINTFAGTPKAVFRAILLESLAIAANKDDLIAAALVACARNTLPHIRLGNERHIWSDLVRTLDDKVERRAEAEWATPDAIEVPPLTLAIDPLKISIKTSKLDREALTENLKDASGPHDQSGSTRQNANPNWPNSGPEWSYEFAPRAATAIAEAIDPVLKVRAGLVDLGVPFEEIAETISQHFKKTLDAVSRATAGLQRRTYLIWWKEALYSPSLRRSYRDLQGIQAAALMAFDLYNQVPNFTPLSVSSFLNEAVRSLPQIDVEERKHLLELMKTVAVSEELAVLRASVESLGLGQDRGPLLALIGNCETATMEPEQFNDLTGVPADTALSLPDLAVWLFRDLQAMRATLLDRPTLRSVRKARR